MKYIIRMSINWKNILEDKDNIIFLGENAEDKTIEIEVEDIDNFTSKNNFHIEYEIFMPGLIKLGLNTVGVIVSPNFRNEEMEKSMAKVLVSGRKRGISMHLGVQNYDDIEAIYLANNKLIKVVEQELNKSVKSLNEEQLESLTKIINGHLDNSRKMFLIGEVFKGKIIHFLDTEGEEYKTVPSSITGTTLNIENGLNSGIREIIDKGEEEGKSPYESLKEAGYIKNPIDDFYSKE